MRNMLRITLDEREADYLLGVVRTLSGGEELSEREQLILLLGVRWMQHRDGLIDQHIQIVSDAISAGLRSDPDGSSAGPPGAA